MSEPKKPGLLTVKEVAEQWRVTERTVWNWIDKGAVRATKKGGVVRIVADSASATNTSGV